MVSYEMPPVLTPEALIGALLAAGNASFLPAQLWPLQASFEEMADDAETNGPVGRALLRMPKGMPGPDLPYPMLRHVMHNLVRSGRLTPVGRGWEAGYKASARWIRESEGLLAALDADDVAVLRSTAQRLVAMATMASKKPRASRPVSSVTI
jgi:hypothetical protein